jgi:hypothetical protein
MVIFRVYVYLPEGISSKTMSKIRKEAVSSKAMKEISPYVGCMQHELLQQVF